MTSLLKPGDTFPELKLELTNGRTLSTPDGLSSDFSMVIFFRGHW